jgi:hypothetical protein
MNVEEAEAAARTAVEEKYPRDTTVRHGTLPLILGSVTGYGTEPFTGAPIVMVQWPGMSKSVGYQSDEIRPEA